MNITYNKLKRKIWSKIVNQTRNRYFYPYIYRSYWNSIIHKKHEYKTTDEMYYTACPNPGAGIGHQIANWIAGYWYAKQFNLKFAYIPFSTNQWDDFLGFSRGEVTVAELKQKGYKTRKLPLFKQQNKSEIELVQQIITSYAGKKIIFIAEQDQYYKEQYGVMEDIKAKFYLASARKKDNLVYLKDNFNIAIHVRRGDIMIDSSNPNLSMRFSSNDYFEKVLQQVINHIKTSKPIHIYIFSQGKPEDYQEFSQYPNIHWCLTMNAQESFLHLVYADLLITSKSSFSYKSALLCNGIKICPRNFWHSYPNSKDWILVMDDGTFNIKQLQ